jgi:hypothetical protein
MVAVLLPALYETVAGTGVDVAVTTSDTDELVIVAGFIASLKVTVGATFTETPAVPFAGAIATTFGGVRSGAAAVAKVELKVDCSAFPDRSLAPVVTTTL